MDSSRRSWLSGLTLVITTLFLITSVVLWKQSRDDMEYIHETNRQLKADLEAEKTKLREELDNVQHEKRQLKLNIKNEMSVHSQRLDNQVNRIKRDLLSNSDRKRMPEDIQSTRGLGGAVYVHWGRTTCPSEDTETVYSGVAGGGSHAAKGAAVNMVCLSKEPTWGRTSAVGAYSVIMGAEYEVQSEDIHFGYANARALADHNVPCAVCRSVTRATSIMIPGQNSCTSGWHQEYSGYLMAGFPKHEAGTEYTCIDSNPEADPAGYRNENGHLLYFVKGVCGSLPCPPYVEAKELTCVVCTK